MHDAETRALKRAALLLLFVSAARWGWSATRPPMTTAAGGTVLPELLAASGEAAEEQARRAEPLAEGERVDPNTADEITLDRLPGVGPSTARAILAARDSGVVFRAPEDLLALRGVGPASVAKMRPHLDFSAAPAGRASLGAARLAQRALRVPDRPALVDINRADHARLQELPGVGPALASRIIEERGKRPFTSLADLERVAGIGPATVAKLGSYATVGP